MRAKEDVPAARAFLSKERHLDVAPQELSDRRMIGLKQAADTIKATTQMLLRSAVLPLARCHQEDRMFECPRLGGIGYTDTMDRALNPSVGIDMHKYSQQRIALWLRT